MKPTVYIETTVVSYPVADPSKDLIQAAHQAVTRDWWARRGRFELFASAAVVAEARRGDAAQAARRLEALRGMPLASAGAEVDPLVRRLLRTGMLPARARGDALHVAIAAVNGLDYLLTWNLRHLANASIRGRIDGACREAGLVPPVICTPEELMEAES
jgi:hypothetical protein